MHGIPDELCVFLPVLFDQCGIGVAGMGVVVLKVVFPVRDETDGTERGAWHRTENLFEPLAASEQDSAAVVASGDHERTMFRRESIGGASAEAVAEEDCVELLRRIDFQLQFCAENVRMDMFAQFDELDVELMW
ncbi:hypothetical protein SDC9_178167 [bioreactor metagenome]|uniref:Uncharacterized protein n=1 Tax=bioreactor metagenome TaxID=1076179 RepID=A0A645GWQ9_9ZZZZ